MEKYKAEIKLHNKTCNIIPEEQLERDIIFKIIQDLPLEKIKSLFKVEKKDQKYYYDLALKAITDQDYEYFISKFHDLKSGQFTEYTAEICL